MKNCISINLKKNNIILKIAEKATWEEIEASLSKKVDELKKLYKDDKTPIAVTGKTLKTKEMEDIQRIIEEKIKVKIEFDTPKKLGLHEIKKTFSRDIKVSETKYIKNSLRSGQKVEFEGSLVILGDLNGGAEAIAGENIIVLGVLRGLAHAGAKGNKKAIIAANRIECPQLRIANIVREIEKEDLEQEYKYASIDEENKIILE